MGNNDRVRVIIKDSEVISPTINLQHGRKKIAFYIGALRERMRGHENDAEYAAARLIGIIHERTSGNLFIGVTNTGPLVRVAIRHPDPSARADLFRLMNNKYAWVWADASIVIVDAKDFTWKAYEK